MNQQQIRLTLAAEAFCESYSWRRPLFLLCIALLTLLFMLTGVWGPVVYAASSSQRPQAQQIPGFSSSGFERKRFQKSATSLPRYVSVTGHDDQNACDVPQYPCATIQHAIDVATVGDEIRVAIGTYQENLTISKPLFLVGGYDAHTWERGFKNAVTQIDGSAVQQTTVRFEESSEGSVLDRFTITGGYGETAGGIEGQSSITLRNCLIQGNFAEGPNSWGGAGVLAHKGLTMENCLITGNRTNAGAGGIRIRDGLTLTNVLIADNDGGMAIYGNGAMTLMNVTIVNNDGGIRFSPFVSTTAHLVNSIVWGNRWSIGSEGVGYIDVSYSNIQGGWPGEGNLNIAPNFIREYAGDYHLASGSPMIDAGTNINAPDHDLEGMQRPLDGTRNLEKIVDMGAYEFKEYRSNLPLMLGLPIGGGAFRVLGRWEGLLSDFAIGELPLRSTTMDIPFVLVLNKFSPKEIRENTYLAAGYASFGLNAPLSPAIAILEAQAAGGVYSTTILATLVRNDKIEFVQIQGELNASASKLSAHDGRGRWRTTGRTGLWEADHTNQGTKIDVPVVATTNFPQEASTGVKDADCAQVDCRVITLVAIHAHVMANKALPQSLDWYDLLQQPFGIR